jgi:hypothetical protein
MRRILLGGGAVSALLAVGACAVSQKDGNLASYDVNLIRLSEERVGDGGVQITASLGSQQIVSCPSLDSHVDVLLNGRPADNLVVGSLEQGKLGPECMPASATWTLTSKDVDVFSPSLHIEFSDSSQRVALDADRYFLFRSDACTTLPCGDIVPSSGSLMTIAHGSMLALATSPSLGLEEAGAVTQPAFADGGVDYVPGASINIVGHVNGTTFTLDVSDTVRSGTTLLYARASAPLESVRCSPAGVQCDVRVDFAHDFLVDVSGP